LNSTFDANSPNLSDHSQFITSIHQKPMAALEPYVQQSFICSFNGRYCPPDFASLKSIPHGSSRIALVKHGFGFEGRHQGYHLFIEGPSQNLTSLNTDTSDWNQVVGVEIKPGALKTLTGIAGDDLKEAIIPLEMFWGSQADQILNQLEDCDESSQQLALLEEQLFLKIQKNPSKDHFVLEATKYIERHKGQSTLKSFLSQTGYSRSQVFRKFEESMGLSPKSYAQVVRFKNLLMDSITLLKPDWARLASEYGYYDQAHLAHDFYKVTGKYPESFHKEFLKNGSFIPGETQKNMLLYKASDALSKAAV
jgi:AraC-like DNA-binding protein